MPVYLFTFHAYRSWGPERAQGYVRRGQGILPQDFAAANAYDSAARHPRVSFDDTMRETIIECVRGICDREQRRLHYACVDATHTHILVSWRGFEEHRRVSTTFKRHIGAALSKRLNRPGPWLSRGYSRKRVTDAQHLAHLMNVYLPKHRGAHWREGQ